MSFPIRTRALRFAFVCRIIAIRNRSWQQLLITRSTLRCSATAPIQPIRAGSVGKGASLCRLVNLGYRVPAGFVITRDAFQSTLKDMGLAPALGMLDSLLAGSGDTISTGEQIHHSILSRRIPARILEPIMEMVENLQLWKQPCEGVIVRSSATIEDGSAHSFAGIFESIPISAPEEFEPTVRKIWASVFSPRALSYFREVGVQQVPAMAVVIQRFLRAERSGAMFTRFAGPDGKQSILVEHVEGDCEKTGQG